MIKKKFFMPPFKPEGEWAKEVLEWIYNVTNGDPNGKSLYLGDPDNPREGDIIIEEGTIKKLVNGAMVEITGHDVVSQIFPDERVYGLYFFELNDATGKLALYESIGGVPYLRNEFGSMITDEFTSTVAMGGLNYQHEDGYRYDIARVSPTGEGRSAVLGNYASRTFAVSNIDGFWHVYETQNWVQELINDTANFVTSDEFTLDWNPTDSAMHYGGMVTLQSSYPEEKRVLYRSCVKDKATGKILHETITESEWNATSDLERLERLGAEWLTIPAGDTDIWLSSSRPFPIDINDSTKEFCWQFSEPITIAAISASQPKFDWGRETIIMERVATREWVEDNLIFKGSESEVDADNTVDKGARLAIQGNASIVRENFYQDIPNVFLKTLTMENIENVYTGSGADVAVSGGNVGALYNESGYWKVWALSGPLHFSQVTNTSGAVELTVDGVNTTLTIGNQTQSIASTDTVEVTSIGTTIYNNVDTMVGLKIIDTNNNVVWDDTAIGPDVYLLDGTSKTRMPTEQWVENDAIIKRIKYSVADKTFFDCTDDTTATVRVNNVNRILLDSSDTKVYSPDSTKGIISLSNVEVSILTDGTSRFSSNASNTTVTSKTADKSALTLSDTTATVSCRNASNQKTSVDISHSGTIDFYSLGVTRAQVSASSFYANCATNVDLRVNNVQRILANSTTTTIYGLGSDYKYTIDVNSHDFYVAGVNKLTIQSDGIRPRANITPASSNLYSLGANGIYYTAVYATNGTIQTSDERQKKDIADLPGEVVLAISKLRPVEYRWKENDNGKHIGFIAQEVESVFQAAGLNPADWFVISYEEDIYSLVYAEFIAAILKYVQSIDERLKIIESTIGI